MSQRRTIIVLILLLVAVGLLFWNLQETASPMKISNPRAVIERDGGGPFPVYLTLENTGGADRLIGVKSPVGDQVMIMAVEGEGGAVIPAGSKPSFASDGAHIMVMDTDADLQDGTFLSLVLAFETAGELPVKALVRRPASKGSTDAGGGDTGKSDAGAMAHDMHAMNAVYEVAAGEPAPELSIDVQPISGSGGYRVSIETGNFEFFQPDSNQAAHAPGQGHAHLYLNGLKLQRMYGHEAEIGALPSGKHSVRVTLNTNDHRAYLVDGKTVTAETQIDVAN